MKLCPIFDSSPLHQFSKVNNFLWICWSLGKNLSNFKSPAWNLHCHILQPKITPAQTYVIQCTLPTYVLHQSAWHSIRKRGATSYQLPNLFYKMEFIRLWSTYKFYNVGPIKTVSQRWDKIYYLTLGSVEQSLFNLLQYTMG